MVRCVIWVLSTSMFLVMETIASLIRCEVSGKENIPQEPYILCPVHKGDLDPYIVRRALGRPLSVLHKDNNYLFRLGYSRFVRELFLAWWGGWILEDDEVNVIPLRGAVNCLNSGESVTIFPEGHNHGQGRIETGAAFLSCRSGKTLLPLIIENGVFVDERTPFYVFPFVVLWRYLRESPRVTVRFCEPIYPDVKRYNANRKCYVKELSNQLANAMEV